MKHANRQDTIRPRDLALLLLASGELLPRQRARDQQPDRAGLELKRRVLNRLAGLDPEPDELEAALMNMVDEFGPPTGSTRAIASTFLDEWRQALAAPDIIGHLLGQAVDHTAAARASRGNPP